MKNYIATSTLFNNKTIINYCVLLASYHIILCNNFFTYLICFSLMTNGAENANINDLSFAMT